MQASISLSIPEPIAFIRPLIARYNEIYRAEPIVGYFCLMLAVQQVLDSQLHTENSTVAEFASYLMNTLEEIKSDKNLLNNEKALAVLDTDGHSQEYIMNFATGIFDKAELNTLTQKVSKSTAASFAAAAVFLGLEAIWNPLSEKTKEKIKFSKFQAARILRAIKAGEDPNTLYEIQNPDTDEEKELNAIPDKSEPQLEDHDPTVERATEDDIQENGDYHQTPHPKDSDHVDSDGELNSELGLPEAPKDNPEADVTLPQAPSSKLSDDITLPQAPNNIPDEPSHEESPPHIKPSLPPKEPNKTEANPVKHAQSVFNPSQNKSPAEIMVLTKSTGDAQKHAKYAISALNYDDVSTAISELEKAIELLRPIQ